MPENTPADGTDGQKVAAGECDLDRGYVSPVRTVSDLSFCNIRSVLLRGRYLQILILLTVLGLILRFWHLGFNSLWLDEASTYDFSIRTLPGIWQAIAGGEYNPPLFYATEHFMLMLGNSEFILRLVPAIAGALSIPVFYLVGKEFFDRNAGIIAAACAAYSPFLIYYSQEARAYSLMLFFLALATLFFLRSLRSATLPDWALFGAFSALAFWSHFYAFVMIAALVLFALITEVPRTRTGTARLKMIGAGIGVFLVLCLPLVPVTIRLAVRRIARPPSWGNQGLDVVTATVHQLLGQSPGFLFLVLLGLLIAGLVQTWFLDRKKGLFLVFVAGVTFAVSCILSFLMPMAPHYLIFLSIVFFLCIAMSYRAVIAVWNHRAAVYLLVIALFFINVPALAGYYSGYAKEDWRGFSADLAGRTNPGDTVVVIPSYISHPLEYYFSPVRDQTLLLAATTGRDLENRHLSCRAGNRTVYFVVMDEHLRAANPDGSALAWLRNNANFAGSDTTTKISLYTCR